MKIDHPNIVKLFDVYETSTHFYLAMEHLTGGELFDRIVEKGFYSEKDAADALAQLASAISYLHERGIVHRDVKPENLLYASPEPNAPLKLADFGLCKALKENDITKTACGTPGYVAPEVLKRKGYAKEVDVWSIGVIMYILLCGFPPFYDENTAGLFEQIKNGDYSFPDPYWTAISADAKSLVKSLLTVDPVKRIKAREVMTHPWMKNASPEHFHPDTMQGFRNIAARKRFRMGVLAAVAANRFTFLAENKEH